MVQSTGWSAFQPQHSSAPAAEDVRLEPVPRLEWALAAEGHPPSLSGASPASLRRSWVHTAPEAQVLELFRKLHGSARRLPAPWWLRALDRGELPGRQAAFEIEDAVHATLRRPGWVFVPWVGVGESGFWEYAPSDRGAVQVPTAVVLTDEHPGWLNALPAHAEAPPRPVPVAGPERLAAELARIESW
ncbi:hypothetical protein [Saccharopolyspora montiporae]|uniref:hypothetical protein n=1 Tax=Saccharopolyspora montiporae TaxID=2781240 RepID=UPI001D157CA0|nr:hypothetical protein [Saccharopolyspora sp. HNM0983]